MKIDNSTVQLNAKYDYLAPDKSEIRLLCHGELGGFCHCTLPAGQTSAAVKHKNVEELWYVLEGEGEIWCETPDRKTPIRVKAGTSVTIPPKVAFQFRADTSGPLKILIATIPRWPGPDEAEPSKGFWP
jgi:mannose-6-phosphate isomerase-like protein (cupin superfamily)